MTSKALGPFNLDRVFAAIQKQRERLLRATQALDRAGIVYAVAGDHAVASWVARIDESAVRNPAKIEVVVRREDLSPATDALRSAGFEHHLDDDRHVFVDGPNGRLRDGVHVLIANERMCAGQLIPTPDVVESEPAGEFRVLLLDALVHLLLNTFHTVESMHLRDMLDVGLIDSTWTGRLPPELAARLQSLVDTPDG
jgi:hypothetical protein